MKLTYWIGPHRNDSGAYNIRAKTKREVLDKIANHWNDIDYKAEDVRKVELIYDSAFDLMEQCMGEDGGYWEH